MGGGSRPGSSFIVRARADGRREFFQHDDREYDKHASSSNYSSRSKYSYGRGGGGRSWQSESGYGRGSNQGYRGKYSQSYVNNEDSSQSEGKGRHQELYENSRRLRRGKKESYRGRSDAYRGRSDAYRGRSDAYRGNAKTSISYRALWHKIVIYDTTEDMKVEVMDIIKGNVDDIFTPVLFVADGKNLIFYLEKQPHIAKAILTLSNRVSLNNGHKLFMKCFEVPAPLAKKLTEEQRQVVIAVMSDRYGIEMKFLNLKNFHNDPTLIREQIFCPLYRRIGLTTVLEIIISHIPEVEEIDFSNNQLNSLSDLEVLRDSENLKRLNFDHNRLSYIDGAKMKEIPVEEISFIGNPVRDKYKDNEAYRTVITKAFPKVRIVDGVEVERPIGFVVETEVLRVPKSKPSFFCNEEAKAIVLKFIEQYYQVYESERTALGAAYTEDALFSLTSSFPSSGFGSKNTERFHCANRNLLLLETNEKKHRLLAKGRLDVIDAICGLPPVSHDPHSFIIDMPIVQPRLIHVVLMGVFKQIIESPQLPIRSFMRALIIVPVGTGFCISNEELFINAATVQQISKAFKTVPQGEIVVPAIIPAAGISSPSNQGPALGAQINLEPSQLEMIQRFAASSKMLPEYCKVCLEENNWDFQKAGELFLNLQKENKIPPEYYGVPI